MPVTTCHLWPELYAAARRDGLVLQRALTPGAEARRGRYFLRDIQSGGVVIGVQRLPELRRWMQMHRPNLITTESQP